MYKGSFMLSIIISTTRDHLKFIFLHSRQVSPAGLEQRPQLLVSPQLTHQPGSLRSLFLCPLLVNLDWQQRSLNAQGGENQRPTENPTDGGTYHPDLVFTTSHLPLAQFSSTCFLQRLGSKVKLTAGTTFKIAFVLMDKSNNILNNYSTQLLSVFYCLLQRPHTVHL